MGKVREKVKSYLGVRVNFRVSEEIAEEYGIRNRSGVSNESGGYARYKVENVTDLQEFLTYTSQEYLDNLKDPRAKYMLPSQIKEGFNVQDYRIEDGDIYAFTGLQNILGGYDQLGYTVDLRTPFVAEQPLNKFDRMYVNVKYAEEFETIRGGLGDGEQRRKEQLVTSYAEHEVTATFTSGEEHILTGNYLTELRDYVKTGKELKQLKTVIYSQEANLKFVQELNEAGLEAWYEEIEEAEIPEIKKLRNFGGRGAVLYSRHKNVQIRVDGKKNVYVARYGPEHTWRNEDKVVVAKWDGIEGNEAEIWKVYDEEVSKQI